MYHVSSTVHHVSSTVHHVSSTGHHVSSTIHHVSSTGHHVSSTGHPSCVLYRSSCVLYRSSCVLYRSSIMCPQQVIMCPLRFIVCPLQFIMCPLQVIMCPLQSPVVVPAPLHRLAVPCLSTCCRWCAGWALLKCPDVVVASSFSESANRCDAAVRAASGTFDLFSSPGSHRLLFNVGNSTSLGLSWQKLTEGLVKFRSCWFSSRFGGTRSG